MSNPIMRSKNWRDTLLAWHVRDATYAGIERAAGNRASARFWAKQSRKFYRAWTQCYAPSHE